MKKIIIMAMIVIALATAVFAQDSQPPGPVEQMVSTDPDLFPKQSPAPDETTPPAQVAPEGYVPAGGAPSEAEEAAEAERSRQEEEAYQAQLQGEPAPAGEQTSAGPTTVYGKFTYNEGSNTYSEGPVTYRPDPVSGLYTTAEGKNAYGQTSYTAFDPQTGQEVVYAEGQPTFITTYDSQGVPTTVEITRDSQQYKDFVGNRAEPRPTYSTRMQAAAEYLQLYDQYRGLAVYSSLILGPGYSEQVQQNREVLQRQFCIALGIKNCLASTICRQIFDVRADNVAVGIGPTGEYVSSAAITAERSPALEVAGMTAQQLIDLFGVNTTTIAGRTVNLAAPDFDPATLGQIQIRMYHVQFGITNNAETGRTTAWNIEFRTPTGIRRRWYAQDQLLPYTDTSSGHVYKLSATEYKEACLVFDTELAAGKYGPRPTYIDEFCRDFVEYAGGPESVAVVGAPAAAAPTATGADGGNI
ncbi:MAG TPA: hypothetical protein VI612_03275 [Candidatus Nanoarchaeia archaeon]|nr:hypothetical protein [Candidatus Nanoarchaeia archaeon]